MGIQHDGATAPRPPGAFRRTTSMLFSILAEDPDAVKAQEVLSRATEQLQRKVLDNAQADRPKHDTLQIVSDSASEVTQQGHCTAAQGSTTATNPVAGAGAGTGTAGSWPGDAAAAEHEATSTSVAGALAEDRCVLAAHLAPLTPEAILQELLGSLFVHPSRLEYEGLLGEGAFATVHRATLLPCRDGDGAGNAMGEVGSTGLSMVVAVKQLKPEVLSEPHDLRDFLCEANIMRKLRHPNIVAIRGIGARDLSALAAVRRSVYCVMEALEGGNLKMMVLRQMTGGAAVYEARDALRWAVHIASAMHYLHAVCRPMIIHRDMKLENVLLSDGPMDGRVAKLADFGLHKRARLNAATGSLVAPPSIPPLPLATTSHTPAVAAGPAQFPAPVYDDKSYYGGGMYYGSVHGGPGGAGGGSVHFPGGASVHGGKNGIGGTAAGRSMRAGSAYGAGGSSVHGSVGGSLRGGMSSKPPGLPPAAATTSVLSSGEVDGEDLGARAPAGMPRNPSLKSLVTAAATAVATQQLQSAGSGALGQQARNASYRTLQALAATDGSRAPSLPPSAGPSVHGGASALAALQAVRTGSAAAPAADPVPPATLQQLARTSGVQAQQPAFGSGCGTGTPTTSQAQAGTSEAALPPGMATLLSDPAQAGTLTSLAVLLAHGSGAGPGDADEEGPGLIATTGHHSSHQAPGNAGVAGTGGADAACDAGTVQVGAAAHWPATDHAASAVTNGSRLLQQGPPGRAGFERVGSPAPTNVQVMGTENASVHRKMLALMALDAAAVAEKGEAVGARSVQQDRCDVPVRTSGGGTAAPASHTADSPSGPGPSQQNAAAASSAASAPAGEAVMAVPAAGSAAASQTPAMRPIPEDGRPSTELTRAAAKAPEAAGTGAGPGRAAASGAVAGQAASAAAPAPASAKGAAASRSQGSRSNKGTQAASPSGIGATAGRGAGVKMGAAFVDATQQVGSLMYMSPELLVGHVYNEKVDVFSFGVMMYELFAGRLLAVRGEFLAGGEDAVQAYVAQRAQGARERLPTRWPPELRALIAECWAHDPAARPGFGEVLARLKAMAAAGTLASMPARPQDGAAGCCAVM